MGIQTEGFTRPIPVTEEKCREIHKDSDGRFYFWRNGFLGIIVVVFASIGSCYLYITVKSELQNERLSKSDTAIALVQKDLDYIKAALAEQKELVKEALRK